MSGDQPQTGFLRNWITTPSAPLRMLRDDLLMSRPPLLGEEGKVPNPPGACLGNDRIEGESAPKAPTGGGCSNSRAAASYRCPRGRLYAKRAVWPFLTYECSWLGYRDGKSSRKWAP